MTESELQRMLLIASALDVADELKAARATCTSLSRRRAVLVRELHARYHMTHRDIGEALGISGPRVHEIIHSKTELRCAR